MKKIFFLYFLFTLPTGSVHLTAQVTIGSDHAPRAGAGLDLDSDKGLLLPKVSLSGSATDFQLDGDPAKAKGMMLYNTGSGLNGPGIYVWDGTRWNLSTCSPAAPTGITFSKEADIALNERITAAAIPEVTTGTSIPVKYNWTIPGDYFDIVGEKNVREITLQAKAATTEPVINTIKVNAENACGKSEDYANITTLNILNCSAAPATPETIALSATTVNLNNTFTASVPEVTTGTQIPTSYTWTVPGGLSISGSSTGRSITITGSTAGTYAAGQIKVTATNACGTSAAQSNASAVTVRVCSAAPATPETIALSATTVNLNGTFTASVPEVTTGTQIPTSYTWTVPGGLSISGSSTGRSITITGSTAGTYAAGTIKVTATNACGTSAAQSSASAVTVRVCSAAPATPGTITLSATYVHLNGTFTASVPEVTTGTQIPTSYTWTVPGGLTISGSSTGRSITITGSTAGTYAAGQIKVTATNACGTSAAQSNAAKVAVDCPGYLAIGGEYATSKTGYLAIPEKTTFATLTGSTWGFAKTGKDLCFYKTDGNSGSITSWTNVKSGCEGVSTTYNDGRSGWRLPSIAELAAIQSIYGSLSSRETAATGTVNMTTNDYWSSNEYNGLYASTWRYIYSHVHNGMKSDSAYVRCVRSY